MEASQKLTDLSALLGNVGEKIVIYEQAYIAKKVDIMDENEKMPISKVEILAQNTEEHRKLREVKMLQVAMIESIRALKYRLKVLSSEHEASVNL